MSIGTKRQFCDASLSGLTGSGPCSPRSCLAVKSAWGLQWRSSLGLRAAGTRLYGQTDCAAVKTYLKSNKNDANDAEAICEAMSRPHMRFVTIKTVEQHDIQTLHLGTGKEICFSAATTARSLHSSSANSLCNAGEALESDTGRSSFG